MWDPQEVNLNSIRLLTPEQKEQMKQKVLAVEERIRKADWTDKLIIYKQLRNKLSQIRYRLGMSGVKDYLGQRTEKRQEVPCPNCNFEAGHTMVGNMYRCVICGHFTDKRTYKRLVAELERDNQRRVKNEA